MRRRFLLAAVLATLWTSAGCEMWLHHHGYWPNGTPGAPAPSANYCVPMQCVPCSPGPAAYTPPAVPSWNTPTGASAGTVCCPPPPPHQ